MQCVRKFPEERFDCQFILIMRLAFLQLYTNFLSFLLLPHALGTYLKRTLFS